MTEQSVKQSVRNEEVRIFKCEELRVHAPSEGEAARFEGVAIRYNSWSEDLGGFREIIKPGSATKALKVSDVRALKNHDPNTVLARTKPGRNENTLTLTETKNGVEFSFEVPDIQVARDLMVSVDRGDIDQCSFAFRLAKGGEEWKEVNDESPMERTITEFSRISDVSIVTYPAYTDTSVALRSMTEYRDANENTEGNRNEESNDSCTCECQKQKSQNSESNDEGNQEPEFDAGKLDLMKKKIDLKLK
jgi:HK97 family phage prohead protease